MWVGDCCHQQSMVPLGESQAAVTMILCVILQGTVKGPSSPHPNADYAQQQKEILIYLIKKKGCQSQGK